MIPLADIFDLPAEAITVLAMLLISLISWIKSRFLDKPDEPEPFEDEKMREVIWRRQMGEDSEETLMPWERPKPEPPKARAQPPALPQAVPKFVPPAPPKLSRREQQLANAFERSTRKKSGRRTGHRRKVDRMLSSPSAAKDAILLTEILGPPLAFKPEHQPEA